MTKRCLGVLPEGATLDDFTFRALSRRPQGDTHDPARHTRRPVHALWRICASLSFVSACVYLLQRAWRSRGRDSSIWPRARHIDVSKPHAPPARKRGQANDHAAAQVKSARPIAWIPSCLHTRRTPHGGARHRRSPGRLPRRRSRSSVSPAVQNPRIDIDKVEGPHLLYPPVSSRSRLQLSMGYGRFNISIPISRQRTRPVVRDNLDPPGDVLNLRQHPPSSRV